VHLWTEITLMLRQVKMVFYDFRAVCGTCCAENRLKIALNPTLIQIYYRINVNICLLYELCLHESKLSSIKSAIQLAKHVFFCLSINARQFWWEEFVYFYMQIRVEEKSLTYHIRFRNHVTYICKWCAWKVHKEPNDNVVKHSEWVMVVLCLTPCHTYDI